MGMAVVAIFATLRAVFEGTNQRLNAVIVGVLFGLSAVVAMNFPVQINESLRLDQRTLFVLVGSMFGGPIGAAIATAMPAAFRVYLGGQGEIGGLASILSSGLIGYLFFSFGTRRQDGFSAATLVLSGLLNALASIVALRLVFSIQGLPSVPGEAEEALILISPLVNVILGISLTLTHPRVWRRTERQLAELIETTSDLTWEVDEFDRFTRVSPRYREALGRDPAKMIGQAASLLGGRWIDEATKQTYEAAIAARQPYDRLLRVVPTSGGSQKLHSITGRPVFDGRGRFVGYRGTTSDVTEIEKWRTLMATIGARVGNVVGEDFLRTLVQAVAEVLEVRLAYVGRFDLPAGTVRGISLYSDGAFSARSDIRFEDLPSGLVAGGKRLIVPSGVKTLYPQLGRLEVFADVESYAAVPLISAHGEVLGMLSVADTRRWDAPEYIETVLSLFAGRAAAEVERTIIDGEREEGRRKMAEVLAALDVARDAIILIDRDGKIVYHNRSAGDLMGLPEGVFSAVGKGLREWAVDPNFGRFADGALSAMTAEGEWRGSGPWVRPSDGQTIVFDGHARVLPSGGAVIVATDATARVKLEEEERLKRQREAQAGKVEALGNLAGGIAHDFNNLLGAVLGFGQFLLEDLDPASEQHLYAKRIVSVSERGRSLVRQILTFSRSTTADLTNVVVKEVIAEVHDLLRATLPATTRLIIDNRVEDATLVADKGQLVQVLLNLCVNASDALADEPGTVTISVAPTDRNRSELAHLPAAQGKPSPAFVETWRDSDGAVWIATGAVPQDDSLSIVVTDTGSGIPDAISGQIFEPFRTTKGVGRGTGLGLAVVHRIVREHGGAILVHTLRDHGTSFEVLLGNVAALPHAQIAEPARGTPGIGEATTASILVVDDDVDYCAMIGTALTRLGHRVDTINDPRVALGWVRSGKQHWDILVTDLTMPYIRGSDLIRGFKALSENTRCIICTGYGSGTSEQQALAAGADGFMLKPFDVGQFGNLVANLAKPVHTVE